MDYCYLAPHINTLILILFKDNISLRFINFFLLFHSIHLCFLTKASFCDFIFQFLSNFVERFPVLYILVTWYSFIISSKLHSHPNSAIYSLLSIFSIMNILITYLRHFLPQTYETPSLAFSLPNTGKTVPCRNLS